MQERTYTEYFEYLLNVRDGRKAVIKATPGDQIPRGEDDKGRVEEVAVRHVF